MAADTPPTPPLPPPPPSFIANELISTLTTISLAAFGGGLVGLSILRKRPPQAQPALRHLPLQWAVRCGAFATVFCAGKATSELARDRLYEAYPPPSSLFLAPLNKVFDATAGGVLAGSLGSSVGGSVVRDGAKLLKVGAAEGLTVGFMMSRGATFGVVAGLVEILIHKLEQKIDGWGNKGQDETRIPEAVRRTKWPATVEPQQEK